MNKKNPEYKNEIFKKVINSGKSQGQIYVSSS